VNPYNRARDWGSCNFDVRQIFNTSLIVMSPVHGQSFASRILKDWQLSPIIQVRSGIAPNVTLGVDNSLTGAGQDRPDLVLSSVYASERTPTAWLNRAAFATPAIGRFGILGRDMVNGAPQLNFDLSLVRTYPIRERLRMEARAEAFNAINHANFGNPITSLSSSPARRSAGPLHGRSRAIMPGAGLFVFRYMQVRPK
jgi:hypothetical protein